MFLGVAVKTLANWRCRGVGPSYVQYGSRIAYLREDLVAYRDEHRVVCGEAA